MPELAYNWALPDDTNSVGSLVDQRPWFRVEAPQRHPYETDIPLPVFISLAKGPGGKLFCDGIIVGDLMPYRFQQHREINAARLREISIPRLVAMAVKSADLPGELGALVQDLLKDLPRGRPHARGPRGYPDQHFQDVAAMYRRALVEAPESPTKWVADQYSTSLPTARRWIQRARDRGHLGGSMPGKAGEVTQNTGGNA